LIHCARAFTIAAGNACAALLAGTERKSRAYLGVLLGKYHPDWPPARKSAQIISKQYPLDFSSEH
jgi:hypothetical protein